MIQCNSTTTYHKKSKYFHTKTPQCVAFVFRHPPDRTAITETLHEVWCFMHGVLMSDTQSQRCNMTEANLQSQVRCKSVKLLNTSYFTLSFFKINAVVKVDERRFYSSGDSLLRPCQCSKGSRGSNKYSMGMKALQWQSGSSDLTVIWIDMLQILEIFLSE